MRFCNHSLIPKASRMQSPVHTSPSRGRLPAFEAILPELRPGLVFQDSRSCGTTALNGLALKSVPCRSRNPLCLVVVLGVRTPDCHQTSSAVGDVSYARGMQTQWVRHPELASFTPPSRVRSTDNRRASSTPCSPNIKYEKNTPYCQGAFFGGTPQGTSNMVC